MVGVFMGKSKSKKNKSKWIKNECGYWIGLISGLFTIINQFFDTPTWFKMLSGGVAVLFLGLFLERVYRFLVNSSPTRDELEQECKLEMESIIKDKNTNLLEISDNMHKYCHNMRDYLCELEHTPFDSVSLLNSVCINICNDIERTIRGILEVNKVSVCIKQLVESSCQDDDYKKWKVVTVARSGSTDMQRNVNNSKPVLIEDNSDFEVIISPEYMDSIFACKDLTRVEEEFIKQYGKKYKNSTKNYINFYKSTIVVPIRVQEEKANIPKVKKCVNCYHLIGFLCVDTKEVYQGDADVFDVAINYTKTFADLLYKFFESISNIRNSTVRESENQFKS